MKRLRELWIDDDGIAHDKHTDDEDFDPEQHLLLVEKSEYVRVCEENERLMNVEYWPARAKTAERQLVEAQSSHRDGLNYAENLRDQILNLEKQLNHERSEVMRLVNDKFEANIEIERLKQELKR